MTDRCAFEILESDEQDRTVLCRLFEERMRLSREQMMAADSAEFDATVKGEK